MTDQEWQEWSRHYDTLQWTVISIFTAGIGALLTVSFDPFKTGIGVDLMGLILPLAGVFWVANLRCSRHRIHAQIQDRDFRDHTRSHGLPLPRALRMWNVLVGLASGAEVTFALQLRQNLDTECKKTLGSIAVAVLVGCFAWLWNKAKTPQEI